MLSLQVLFNLLCCSVVFYFLLVQPAIIAFWQGVVKAGRVVPAECLAWPDFHYGSPVRLVIVVLQHS